MCFSTNDTSEVLQPFEIPYNIQSIQEEAETEEDEYDTESNSSVDDFLTNEELKTFIGFRETIKQFFLYPMFINKVAHLIYTLEYYMKIYITAAVIIFYSKFYDNNIKRIIDVLEARYSKISIINENMSQNAQERLLIEFKTGINNTLLISDDVDIDVLDIPQVDIVINYSLGQKLVDYVTRGLMVKKNHGSLITFIPINNNKTYSVHKSLEFIKIFELVYDNEKINELGEEDDIKMAELNE